MKNKNEQVNREKIKRRLYAVQILNMRRFQTKRLAHDEKTAKNNRVRRVSYYIGIFTNKGQNCLIIFSYTIQRGKL